jgi:hypothetical protein
MRRICYAATCAVTGAVSAYYAQPYVGRNSDVVLIVVTVFTVFAGFLTAIITIIGEPAAVREGSWRVAEIGRSAIQHRLACHIGLFVLYLVTIGLLFVGVILDKALDDHFWIKIAIERAYLFIGITSFLFTFAVPVALLRIQQERYDAEIERRRQQVGIVAEGSERCRSASGRGELP